MIERTLSKKLSVLGKDFPVVTITGPRESGKTTLARMVFSGYDYVNLEDPDEREFAISDPRGFLRRFTDGVIIDEIQRVPNLLSYIQGIVDVDDKPGSFVLTGSQQFHMMEKVSQTLAGRTAVVNLLPFALNELTGNPDIDPSGITTLIPAQPKPAFALETILFQGLYPRIHDKGLNAHDWLSGYYQTYVETQIHHLIFIPLPGSF